MVGHQIKKSYVILGRIAIAVFGQVAAAEITVLSAGAIEPGLRAAVAAYEQETHHKVKITFNTAPARGGKLYLLLSGCNARGA